MKNKVGDGLKAKNSNWTFKGTVAKNFDKHISRNIPFYKNGHDLISHVSDFFIKEDSLCYEIGCSTGTLTHMLAKRHNSKKKSKFVGIDIEKNMIRQANKKKLSPNAKFFCGDVLGYKLRKSD